MKSSVPESSGTVFAGLDVAAAIGVSGVLTAALETGLLERLCAHPDTAAGHAAALGLASRPTARVLGVLEAAGLAERDAGQRWGATGALRGVALASPGGLPWQRRVWSQVGAHLRDEVRVARCDGEAAERGETYADVVDALGSVFAPAARLVAERLVAQGPVGRVLDVGAGSGVWGLAVLAAAPGARMTALDLPEVVGRVRANAARRGLADRLDVEARSWDAGPFKGDYDVVLLGCVLHLEAPAGASALVARAAAALRPGGRLVIIDSLPSAAPARAIGHTLYALHLAMRTLNGAPHALDRLRQWLGAADLEVAERVALEPASVEAVIARRVEPAEHSALGAASTSGTAPE